MPQIKHKPNSSNTPIVSFFHRWLAIVLQDTPTSSKVEPSLKFDGQFYICTNLYYRFLYLYLLTKVIYENLPFLNAIHKATKAMNIQKALDGLPVRLHKGALRYYREQGIKIPRHLR